MKQLKLYLAISSLAIIAALFFYLSKNSQLPAIHQAQAASKPERKFTALARLEPAGEVIIVSAAAKERFEKIEHLLVKAGEEVRSGQILAYLESYRPKLLLIKGKECLVEEAQARLAQLKAGAKEGEIEAQKAIILKLTEEEKGKLLEEREIIQALASEEEFRQSEYKRYKQLFDCGALSASELEAKRLAMQTAQARLKEAELTQTRLENTFNAQIEEAQSTLRKIKEIRNVDVSVLEAQLRQAKAQKKQAEEDLRFGVITAPACGMVLKILSKEGEAIGEKGLLELGNTKEMLAVAEVYQSDIGQISQGDRALIQGESFPLSVPGTVQEIGHKVSRQKIFSNEPGANFDNRVIEVKIRLSCPKKIAQEIANLTNSQVVATFIPRDD